MTGGIKKRLYIFEFSTCIFSADITPEMLKLCRVTKVNVFFLVLGYVFNFDLFQFSAATLEKGLLCKKLYQSIQRLFYKIHKDHEADMEKVGCRFSKAHLSLSIGNEEKAVALPDMISKSLLSQSCDSKEILNQFGESLKLSQAALEEPDDETKKWIRCLARDANVSDRLDVVKSLRNISPAGTTGESITFVMHK